MTEWKEYKLGEIADITPGFAFKSKDFGQTGELVVKIKDIAPPYIELANADHVDLSSYDKNKLSKYLLCEGDYVVAMTGATIGKVGKLKTDKYAYLNQRVAKIKAKEGVCDDFVYFSICGDDFQSFIQNNIDSNSAQENISANSIGRFPVSLPPLNEQRRIAAILSSLDDKIDLLHRENATLEQMAETLFRQWFVEESKEEWEEKPLANCIKLIGGGTPKTSEPNYWNGSICWLAGGDIASNHKSFVFSSEKSISEEGLNNSSAKLLPENAMVVSARGTVGKYCLLNKPMAFSQSNYGILPFYNNCFFFTYLLVAFHIDELQSAAYGSVFDTITTKTFEGVKVLLPNGTGYIVEFEKMIEPFFSKMKFNNKQIQTLVQTRDGLLGRLMNNEICI